MHGKRTFRIVAVGLLAGMAACAKDPAPVPSLPKEITDSSGIKLILIPAGEFLMGSPDSDEDAESFEKPQHRVRITEPFYLGLTEVTQGQYRTVTGESPSQFKGSDDLPVENVSWEEAVAFCGKLNEREKGQLDGARYRLPTEAEWEYACRAGSTTRHSFGDDPAGLGEVAWFEGNSGGKTHRVGEKRPNAFGLNDMQGNVWEWCQDWYDDSYYGQSSDANPSGPTRATSRVDRGGGWGSSARLCQSANRGRITPDDRSGRLGFRVARVRSGR
jgi:formylglycine-generating enzyme required for sulfatase activity